MQESAHWNPCLGLLGPVRQDKGQGQWCRDDNENLQEGCTQAHPWGRAELGKHSKAPCMRGASGTCVEAGKHGWC